ncbi:MAG: right-handed parallel beta-helix repeat-containing protein [Candidatus Wallbacteria bacterium]|nr:right-handed parallel beta-helix repeat-containing protein [Candidatus Wallbacteria bacterium]
MREVSFGTERTLILKALPWHLAASGLPPAPTSEGGPQFLGESTNAQDVRKLVLQVYNGDSEASGVARQASITLPPFAGNLVLRGVRPGRKRVTVDALDAAGGALFFGAQVVDFAPGKTKFVEFVLRQTAPAQATSFHGGTVSADLRMVASQSPYSITEPIVVKPGAALVIEAGTEVVFSTPLGETPDMLIRGRILLGGVGPRATLRRALGRSPGTRLRIEGTSGNLVTNTDFQSIDGTAIELSNARVTISSSSFSQLTTAIAATGSSPLVVDNTIERASVGVRLKRSTALVQGNRLADSTSGVTAADSSLIAIANVLSVSAAAARHGILIERSAATVSKNRLTAVTGSFDTSGTLLSGLEVGVAVIDSLSGSPTVSSRVELDHNTVQGAAVAGIVSIKSDPVISFNRVLDGSGSAQAAAQGIAVNQAAFTFPKQPLIVSNELVANSGAALGFLTVAKLDPAGGGVLGNAGGSGGNFIRGNNFANLGFAPGVDSTTTGSVDGVFQTRTFQVFGADAILAAATVPIAGAGAPTSVR